MHITFEKKEEKKRKKAKGVKLEDKKEEKEKNEKKEEEFKPTGIVAMNTNQDFIMVVNDNAVVEIPTRLDDAYHYLNEAQKLQKKYPTK